MKWSLLTFTLPHGTVLVSTPGKTKLTRSRGAAEIYAEKTREIKTRAQGASRGTRIGAASANPRISSLFLSAFLRAELRFSVPPRQNPLRSYTQSRTWE